MTSLRDTGWDDFEKLWLNGGLVADHLEFVSDRTAGGDPMSAHGLNRGFTLIELMVVVIIIAALAAMVLPNLMPLTESMKSKVAAGGIANISVALKTYRLNTGRYPTTEEGLDVLLRPSREYNNEPYLERPPNDPWNRRYEYRYPGTHNASSFDLWSQGPDPQKADDDITNWNTTGT